MMLLLALGAAEAPKTQGGTGCPSPACGPQHGDVALVGLHLVGAL